METESHQKQFRGWFIPADVVKLFEEGTIEIEEMYLLSMIDCLVKPDEGCFASNKYLAERLRVSPSFVSHAITKLKRLGLVNQVSFDGRKRYLETAWSRVSVPDQTSPDEDESRLAQPCDTPLAQPCKSGRHSRATIRNSTSSTITRSVERKDSTGRKRSSATRKNFVVEESHIRIAKILKRLLKKHRSSAANAHVDTLAKQISQVSDTFTDEEIRETVEWLVDNYDKPYTPKIYKVANIRSFDKFFDAMVRSKNGDRKLSPAAKTLLNADAIRKQFDEES